MKRHNAELVGALLDGQLTGLRRWRIARHVKACPVCAAEYRKLEQVRRLLADNPAAPEMSDSAEFFWSKVRREIDRRGEQPVEVPVPRLVLADWLRVHRLAVASVTATVLAMLIAGWLLVGRGPAPSPITVQAPRKPANTMVAQTSPVKPAGLAQIASVSTALPDAVATAVEGTDSDVAVIWVSGVPWTSNMTDMMTQFANSDS